MSIENSREAYEEKEKESKEHHRKAYTADYSLKYYANIMPPKMLNEFRDTATESKAKFEKVQNELRKMRDSAEGEALELNVEYDRLIEEAKKTLDVLHKFETEKLGMREKKSESQS